MSSFPSSLVRGFMVLGIGAVLATGHILFAAAAPAPAPAHAMTDASTVVKVRDVETTASTPSAAPVRENCYSEQQIVRSVRGRTMMLSTLACD